MSKALLSPAVRKLAAQREAQRLAQAQAKAKTQKTADELERRHHPERYDKVTGKRKRPPPE